MIDSKTALLLAAMAAHCTPAHFCNNALNLPPDLRAQFDAAQDRARAIRDGAPDSDAPSTQWDPTKATNAELITSIEQNERLIEVIENTASREKRALSDRDRRRIEASQESIAVVNAELDTRPNPGRRTTADELPRYDALTEQSRNGVGQNRRAGILLPENCARPSDLLFQNAGDAWGRDVDACFNAIANRLYDPRLISNATGVEGVGESGGFAVPGTWFRGVLDQALQAAEFAPRCRIFPTDSNSITIPAPDYTDRSTDLAGLSGNWVAEGSAQTPQRLRWRQIELRLNKIFILSEASNELVEDGLGYAAQLSSAMSIATAYSLDAAILSGSGVGRPHGIVGSASAIEIAPLSGQATSTIIFENLVAMFARLAPASQKKACWFIASSALPQLLQMVFPGTSIPILLGNGSATNAAVGGFVGTIFGRPVITTEVAPALGDRGDITLADMSQYGLALRNAARIETDAGPGFARDVQSWRLILRVTGVPLWNAPITPFAGGPTLSWATYMAARA